MTEADNGLTAAQKARMERNRQKALRLRESRLANRPYPPSKGSQDQNLKGQRSTKVCSRVVDTQAGFLLEEDDEEASEPKKVIVEPGPLLASDFMLCEECHKRFMESYLYNNYGVLVCDGCRDSDERHKLITKSDAKAKYLLKDADLDKWEPALKFIVKKNPRNSVWGEMKLYLESQVKSRCMEVWGSDEALEEEHGRRQENREKLKQKKFDKKVKDLRNAVRSSLWTKDTSSHEHLYGPESYDEDSDMYSKICRCGHLLTYEKM